MPFHRLFLLRSHIDHARLVINRFIQRAISTSLYMTVLLVPLCGAQAQPTVFNKQTRTVTISCIRNAAFQINSLAAGFALTAVKGDGNSVVIDPASIVGLTSLPDDCHDRADFTFDTSGKLQTIDMSLYNLTVSGENNTYDIHLSSNQALGILKLNIDSLTPNQNLIEDLIFNKGTRVIHKSVPPGFVSMENYTVVPSVAHQLIGMEGDNPPSISGYSATGLAIQIYPTTTGVFTFNLAGKTSSGQPISDNMTITVCDTGTYAAGEQCNAPADLRLCEGNFFITTTADLTNLARCNVITGDLVIQNVAGLTSLTTLENLVNIGGNLVLSVNPNLRWLNGLNNLQHIGGGIEFFKNYSLEGINTLGKLTRINGRLRINRNPLLTNLQALNKITELGDDLLIDSNDALTGIEELRNISRIDGDLSVVNNEKLSSLIGLGALKEVRGTLSVGGLSPLQDLTGLDALRTVYGDVQIQYLRSLKSLHGLENLTTVGGGMIIEGTDEMTSLQGLNNLRNVFGELAFRYNARLVELDALNNLLSAGSISFDENYELPEAESQALIKRLGP